MSEKRMMATADTLKALRDEKAALQTKLKEVQADIDSVEAELISLMTDEECTGFDRNGIKFSLVVKEYPGAIPEERKSSTAECGPTALSICLRSTLRRSPPQ